ncbi:MAG: gas vesicle protein GvpN [Planctomyces sp.]|jgi:nitric oxide reductase NorQ protein
MSIVSDDVHAEPNPIPGTSLGPAAGSMGNTPTVVLEAGSTFVLTPEVQAITDRAMTYLECGYAVHLAGPAGTGKTTLAFHIAAQLARPVTLIHGNDEFGSSDLVGKDAGYRKSTLVDNYISSVLKTEEKVDVHWTDNKLTTACEQGHVLIYDEFNRSRPEANNTLLSILEEGILNLPRTGGDGYLKVHPRFRAIFTSNPEEYAGVHKTQDALLDRMVTIPVDHYDEATEQDITSAKSGLAPEQCAIVVHIARGLRQFGASAARPTIRSCIGLARVLASRGVPADIRDDRFAIFAWDFFGNSIDPKDINGPWNQATFRDLIAELLRDVGTSPSSGGSTGGKRKGRAA